MGHFRHPFLDPFWGGTGSAYGVLRPYARLSITGISQHRSGGVSDWTPILEVVNHAPNHAPYLVTPFRVLI